MSKLSQVFYAFVKKGFFFVVVQGSLILLQRNAAFVHIVSPQLLPVHRGPESLSPRRRRDLAEQADLHVLVVAGAERGGGRGGLARMKGKKMILKIDTRLLYSKTRTDYVQKPAALRKNKIWWRGDSSIFKKNWKKNFIERAGSHPEENS